MVYRVIFFFFTHVATTEIYTLSLHDALPIFDTAGSLLQGSERIHYENHSPDTLRFLWVQIEQNIFAKNSVTYALNQPPLHFAGGAVFDFTGKGFIGGITIERFRSAGRELRRTEYGTMRRVELPRPLAPRR